METENDNSVDIIDCSDQKIPQDPLHNELVLGTVFKFLTVSELKNVRYVCIFWNKIASFSLGEATVVKFDERFASQPHPLNNFLQDFESTLASNVCFRHYHLVSWLIEPTSRILSFWEKYGPTIRSLEVSHGRFAGREILRKVIFDWTPNLRRLVFRDCCLYSSRVFEEGFNQSSLLTHELVNYRLTSITFIEGEPHVLPLLPWNEIFFAFPNLKQLVLYNLDPIETSPILDVMREIRQNDPTKLAIQKLSIFNCDHGAQQIPGDILLKLINLKLPLVHLDIDIGAHCNEMFIARFLDQHARHLRKLTIYRGPLGSPLLKFPYQIPFPKLAKLEITETVADTFNFIQYTPKLTDLLVCEPPGVEPPFLATDMIFKSNYDFPSFPFSLRYLRIDYDCGIGDVRKVVHWFPLVKSVKMYLNTASFRTVCGNWRDLVELEVLGDKLDDEGITGLRCKKENEKDNIIICNPHSILNLKVLRTFIMTNRGITTAVTDFSVTHGFEKLKGLEHLELCSINVTRDAWRVLTNLPNLKTLIPMDGRNESNCEEFRKGS